MAILYPGLVDLIASTVERTSTSAGTPGASTPSVASRAAIVATAAATGTAVTRTSAPTAKTTGRAIVACLSSGTARQGTLTTTALRKYLAVAAIAKPTAAATSGARDSWTSRLAATASSVAIGAGSPTSGSAPTARAACARTVAAGCIGRSTTTGCGYQ